MIGVQVFIAAIVRPALFAHRHHRITFQTPNQTPTTYHLPFPFCIDSGYCGFLCQLIPLVPPLFLNPESTASTWLPNYKSTIVVILTSPYSRVYNTLGVRQVEAQSSVV